MEDTTERPWRRKFYIFAPLKGPKTSETGRNDSKQRWLVGNDYKPVLTELIMAKE